MKDLEKYIEETLKLPIHLRLIPKEELKGISIYIRDAYTLTEAYILNRAIVLVEPNQQEELKIAQTQKHLATLQHKLAKKGVLVLLDLPAYQRQRLIEKGINFIVPGKQIFLPDLLIDLKEEAKTDTPKYKGQALLPAAQFIVLYHLLHRDDISSIDNNPLHEVALMTGYSQTIMTRVVENLLYYKLISVQGTKEKTMQFLLPPRDLWQKLIDDKRLTTPVLKRVFVDALPTNTKMLRANATAMAEYTEMNPGTQEYYAISRATFNDWKTENQLQNPNPTEGQYCLEVWKYNPYRLATSKQVMKGWVDPLSLYLSMQDIQDERIEMALDQIINEMLW